MIPVNNNSLGFEVGDEPKWRGEFTLEQVAEFNIKPGKELTVHLLEMQDVFATVEFDDNRKATVPVTKLPENNHLFASEPAPETATQTMSDDSAGDELTVSNPLDAARERTKEIAASFLEKGDATGWFDALYKEAEGDNERIPWADLEPNRFFREWAEKVDLRGDNRTALVVGCGLGDDARYLHDLGFKVTGFDISPTAIEWARRLHHETDINFLVADLFDAPKEWFQAFDFVLEIYTIQPLPMEMRKQVIDAIANFVKFQGQLVVVTRGREDDEIPTELPWALSRKDLSRFDENGFRQISFEEQPGDEDPPVPRFVIEYVKR